MQIKVSVLCAAAATAALIFIGSYGDRAYAPAQAAGMEISHAGMGETGAPMNAPAETVRNWHCQKCRTHVQSPGRPSAGYCPEGGHHRWNNLGVVGAIAYQCRKCNLTVESRERPSSGYCPSGGHHQWNRLTR